MTAEQNTIKLFNPEKIKRHRIGIFEDDKAYFEEMRVILGIVGIELELIADNIEEALLKIPNLANDGFEMVLVDGNLTEGSHGGYEGKKIIARIKDLGLPIITVGQSFSGSVEGADHNINKKIFPDIDMANQVKGLLNSIQNINTGSKQKLLTKII